MTLLPTWAAAVATCWMPLTMVVIPVVMPLIPLLIAPDAMPKSAFLAPLAAVCVLDISVDSLATSAACRL